MPQGPSVVGEENRRRGEIRELLITMRPTFEDALGIFKKVSDSWQPADYLPNLSVENPLLEEHRAAARGLTLDELTVLVGDTITEEGLPTYTAMIRPYTDENPSWSDDPMSVGLRHWAGEENRHGDLLMGHLALDPRVNMRKVQETVQHELREGFDSRALTAIDTFVYTSFQERATFISHINLGRMIGERSPFVKKSSMKVSSDEKRHELYYKENIMGEAFRQAPEIVLLAYADMMKRKISMPAINIRDTDAPPAGDTLFEQFSMVAQRIGVYTVRDYASIISHLNEFWHIEKLHLSGKLGHEARQAQEEILKLPGKYNRLAPRIEAAASKYPTPRFSWINYDKA